MKTKQENTILKVWYFISPRRRKQFSFLLVLMLIAAVSEVVSIGAVIPFLGVLTTPERVFKISFVQPLFHWAGINKAEQLILPVTIAFMVAAFVSGAIRLLLLWVSTRLSYAVGADLSVDIYRKTLYQPYSIHINRSSSEVISGIVMKANNLVATIIMPIADVIGSFLIMICRIKYDTPGIKASK